MFQFRAGLVIVCIFQVLTSNVVKRGRKEGSPWQTGPLQVRDSQHVAEVISLLCHKDTSQCTQSPLLGGFHLGHWVELSGWVVVSEAWWGDRQCCSQTDLAVNQSKLRDKENWETQINGPDQLKSSASIKISDSLHSNTKIYEVKILPSSNIYKHWKYLQNCS